MKPLHVYILYMFMYPHTCLWAGYQDCIKYTKCIIELINLIKWQNTLKWYKCINILCPLMSSVFSSPGSTQSLPCHTASGDNCPSSICPNTVVNYTCTITNGTAAGLTDWTLPTGTCPTNSPADTIRLSQYTSQQCATFLGGSSMCGPYRTSSILPSSGIYCLSSILTVTITAAMSGITATCSNTNIGTTAPTLVSMATINVVGMSFICIDINVVTSLTPPLPSHLYITCNIYCSFWSQLRAAQQAF